MRHRSRLGLAAGLLFALGLEGSATPSPPEGFLGSYRWTSTDPRFGGFSAIEIDSDGVGFTALSDHGAVITGAILRDSQGGISSLRSGPIIMLRGKRYTGLGKNVLGGPLIALAWLASRYGGWDATLWAMLAFAAGGALCGIAITRIERRMA